MIFFISFRTALRFLTRIPFPGSHQLRNNEYIWSLAWYPVIGALIGLILGATATAFQLFLPANVSITLALIITAVITGAIHEDGLADTCDAIGGGWTREKRLEIMKDSRIGTYGGIGLILLYTCRFSCMTNLPSSTWIIYSICAHCLARWPILFLIKILPAARSNSGIAHELSNKMSWPILCTATALFIILAIALNINVNIIAMCIPLTLSLGIFFQKKIGGITGDLCGFGVCATELLFWIYICAIEHSYIQ